MAKKDTSTVLTSGAKIKISGFQDGDVVDIDDSARITIITDASADSITLDVGTTTGYHPDDVNIEIINNKYTAYRQTPKGKEPLSYPEHRNGEHLDQWVKKLNDSQLEAAIQIYYDRWAFGTGEAIDKIYFDSLDSERTRRRSTRFNIGTPTILPRTNDSDTGFGRGN